MNPKQVLALDALNKGLRAKTPGAACYAALIQTQFYTGSHNTKYEFPYALSDGDPERELEPPIGSRLAVQGCLARIVAIRGDYPSQQRGLLLLREYNDMIQSLRAYYPHSVYWANELRIQFARRIKPAVPVLAWGPFDNGGTRRSWGTLLENLRWLAAPRRASQVWHCDPRVVSFGWYLSCEVPHCFKKHNSERIRI